MGRMVRLDQLQQFAVVNLLLDPGAVGGPMILPDGVKVVLTWTLTDGHLGRNILYGRVAPTFVPSATIAEAIRGEITTGGQWTTLASFMAATGNLTRVELQDMRSEDNPLIPSTGAAVPGTSASTALPDEVAAVVTLRTAKTGPGNRGRYYVPNWASNALGAGGVINAATVTALGTWANHVAARFVGNGLTPALGLRRRLEYIGSTGTLHEARDAMTLVITSQIVRDNHWDSQRRRGLK
jgi:hypothetical protein